MLPRAVRRLLRSRLFWIPLILLAVWTYSEASSIRNGLIKSSSANITPPPNREKIFIASLPWNNEVVLRTHWINQLKDLVRVLGVENVYVSIYENGSYDGTKDAVRDLYRELDAIGVRTRIEMEDRSHAEEIANPPKENQPHSGWIKPPRGGELRLRRIPYLSRLRNRVLEALADLEARGEYFHKVLFLNDVVYTTDDILKLLNTRRGLYAAACALDFEEPPAVYDTFALRDIDGHPALQQSWPYFRSEKSRHAVMKGRPVPVKSCWNGIAVFDATPFYNRSSASHKPLRFRGVADSLAQSHVEGSECCLIHADNPLSSIWTMRGVWINPDVRVGYCAAEMHRNRIARPWEEYKALCQQPYDEVHSGSAYWVSTWQIATGVWQNRIRRWTSSSGWQNSRARSRWKHWLKQKPDPKSGDEAVRSEPGDFCLVDEMQVLAADGWRHL